MGPRLTAPALTLALAGFSGSAAAQTPPPAPANWDMYAAWHNPQVPLATDLAEALHGQASILRRWTGADLGATFTTPLGRAVVAAGWDQHDYDTTGRVANRGSLGVGSLVGLRVCGSSDFGVGTRHMSMLRVGGDSETGFFAAAQTSDGLSLHAMRRFGGVLSLTQTAPLGQDPMTLGVSISIMGGSPLNDGRRNEPAANAVNALLHVPAMYWWSGHIGSLWGLSEGGSEASTPLAVTATIANSALNVAPMVLSGRAAIRELPREHEAWVSSVLFAGGTSALIASLAANTDTPNTFAATLGDTALVMGAGGICRAAFGPRTTGNTLCQIAVAAANAGVGTALVLDPHTRGVGASMFGPSVALPISIVTE